MIDPSGRPIHTVSVTFRLSPPKPVPPKACPLQSLSPPKPAVAHKLMVVRVQRLNLAPAFQVRPRAGSAANLLRMIQEQVTVTAWVLLG
jgi:hypothetical protein